MSYLNLNNRYVLSCKLVSDAGLHVGTGVASVDTDAPFLRQGGDPFIPGSSMRGVMRSTIERIASTLGGGLYCTLFEGSERCDAGNEDRRKELERKTAKEMDAEKGTLRFCPICRLFGSTLQASRLKVTDALPADPESIALNRRDGVGIDRDTGTAREKIKFDFEVLERGCAMDFTIQLENAEDTDFGLLYIGLKEMEYGFDVGGKKARGLGRVKLTGYAVQYFDGQQGHGLRDFLKGGMARMESRKFDEILRGGFEKLPLEGN